MLPKGSPRQANKRDDVTRVHVTYSSPSWKSLCLSSSERRDVLSFYPHSSCISCLQILLRKRERNVLFNDALNTFYLRLYGVRHMVKDHSDSEKGNPLPPHRLLLSMNHPTDRITHTTAFVSYLLYLFLCLLNFLYLVVVVTYMYIKQCLLSF